MTTTARPHYTIDKDISLEMFRGDNNSVYFSIYNDRRNTAIAFQTSVDNMKSLADFIYKQIGTKHEN